MAVTSGFFNSVNGDRKYNADQISKYFDKLITSGVYPNPSTNLQVVASGSGMSVNVSPGRGIINCKWVENDATLTLSLDAANVTLDRIDCIVMRLDESQETRAIDIVIKKGELSSSPVAPSMTRGVYVNEYCLAQIRVNHLTETITDANITDTRANTDVCGWVTGLIQQVDTSTLFKQWQSAYEDFYNNSTRAFNSWYDSLTSQLNVSAHLKRFSRSFVNENRTGGFEVGITEYDGTDYVDVYINGLKLRADEFEIVRLKEIEDVYYVDLVNSIDAGQDIEIVVTKTEIGMSDPSTIISVLTNESGNILTDESENILTI